eukprot:TRINITY_DN104395_c0_g1_i1.p1 TRINITY_DN104395_c0_g1~~TRINITY_DN104395_c0_g1_i1.p1  ORF type:complete len:343 (-),score=74.63 TRINITY_DN104395_c0_g1_i1:144-1172(-)
MEPSQGQGTAADQQPQAAPQSSGLLQRGLEALDEDGDGDVSLNDIERIGEKVWMKFDALRNFVDACVNRPKVHLGVGAIALLYGGHFKTSAVVMSSLCSGQLEPLEEQCFAIAREYRRARQRLEGAGIGGDFVVVRQGGVPADAATLSRAALIVDPRPLLDGLQRLQTAAIAQVAMALNQNTSRLLLGVNLGRWIADVARGPLEKAFFGQGATAEDVPRDVTVEHGHEAVMERQMTVRSDRTWFHLALDASCSALGVFLAWTMRGWAALWTTCGIGSKLIVTACDQQWQLGLGSQAVFWETMLAFLGFAYQARYFGQPPLPWPVWWCLAPARIAEGCFLAIA